LKIIQNNKKIKTDYETLKTREFDLVYPEDRFVGFHYLNYLGPQEPHFKPLRTFCRGDDDFGTLLLQIFKKDGNTYFNQMCKRGKNSSKTPEGILVHEIKKVKPDSYIAQNLKTLLNGHISKK